MKLRNFQDLLEKRFSKEELEEIERKAELEANITVASLAHISAFLEQEQSLIFKKR